MLNKTFIDPQHQSVFQQNGYVVLDLLSEETIFELQKVFIDVEEQHKYDFIASVALNDVAMRRSIHEKIIIIFEKSLLQVLNGYKLILGSFVAKQAASENGKFPLHQDPTFVEETEHVGVSIWCPLIDVDESNGCLGILPGSHHLNNMYRAPGMLPYAALVETIELNYIRYIPMKAGQVMFMNNKMVHGSPKNTSTKIRPVAASVAIPAGLPALCCYVNEADDAATTNVFHVSDDFYVGYKMLSFPKDGQHFKFVQRQIETMSEQKIEEMIESCN